MARRSSTRYGRGARTPETDKRQLDVLKLRLAGLTYDEVAAQLGYKTEASVRYAYNAAMKRAMAEPAAELREIQHQRIEQLWRRAYQVALTDANPDRAMRALDRCAALLERSARLWGLDAPTKQTVTVITEDAVDAELRRLNDELAARGVTVEADPDRGPRVEDPAIS